MRQDKRICLLTALLAQCMGWGDEASFRPVVHVVGKKSTDADEYMYFPATGHGPAVYYYRLWELVAKAPCTWAVQDALKMVNDLLDLGCVKEALLGDVRTHVRMR